MEIWKTSSLHPRPTLIKCLHDILRQRPFLEIHQILLKLLLTTRPNNDSIPLLPAQQRMMTDPPQCTLSLAQPMLFRRSSKNIKRIKIILFPIPLPIIRALVSSRVETTPGFVVSLVTMVT